MPLRTGSELPSLDGVSTWINGAPTGEELAGKPLLVHFWSISCYICHDVAAEVARWQAEYGPRGLEVIGIHQPRGPEELDIAKVTADANTAMGITWPAAIDNEHTARLQLDAASRGNRPSLNAQVSGGMEDGVAPALYDNKGYVQAGLALEVPIFTGRRVTGERMEADAGVRSAEARERELDQSITTEVADAYSDFNAARSRLANADTVVEQAREALDLAQTRYTNGVITNFELLDAQSASRAAELSRQQARYDCVLARQAVARAAGVAPQP